MTFLYILLALVILLVMITVHEFGHYCAGKILGFKINEFAIGFGPKLYSKTKKDGEVFSIRALPLGGFCAFEGEDEDGKSNPQAMNNQPAWKRLIVLLSGVGFNFLFGVLTAAIYLMVSGYATVMVTQTINQQEIQTMGLQKNDIVVAVDGKTVEAYRNFSSLIADYKEGEEFVVTVNRGGKIVDITTKKQKFDAFYYVSYQDYLKGQLYTKTGEDVYAQITDEEYSKLLDDIVNQDTSSEVDDAVGKGSALTAVLEGYYYKLNDEYKPANSNEIITLLVSGNADQNIPASISYATAGVSMGIIQQNVGESYNFFEAVLKAWPFCFYLCGLILSALGGLFTGSTAVSELGGTITAISQMAEISSYGISYFLLLLPLIAMNLAVFNILPIPALDGARALFVLIEIIFRKPVNRTVEAWIHTVGLFVILGLVIFLDVYHFFIASYFLRLWLFYCIINLLWKMKNLLKNWMQEQIMNINLCLNLHS